LGDLEGSVVVREVQDELIAGAEAEIARVEHAGGTIAALESGLMKSSLVASQAARVARIATGEQAVIGRNRYTEAIDSPLVAGADGGLFRADPDAGETLARLERTRASRDAEAVHAALARLRVEARDGANLVPASIECAVSVASWLPSASRRSSALWMYVRKVVLEWLGSTSTKRCELSVLPPLLPSLPSSGGAAQATKAASRDSRASTVGLRCKNNAPQISACYARGVATRAAMPTDFDFTHVFDAPSTEAIFRAYFDPAHLAAPFSFLDRPCQEHRRGVLTERSRT
jgi:hypothetical protein